MTHLSGYRVVVSGIWHCRGLKIRHSNFIAKSRSYILETVYWRSHNVVRDRKAGIYRSIKKDVFCLNERTCSRVSFRRGWRNTISRVDVINGEEAKTRLVELTSPDLE